MNDALQQMAEVRRQCIRKLAPFDAGIWLGLSAGFPLAKELKPHQLQATFDRNFLTGGLVSHWRGATVSAQEGNIALEAPCSELPAETYVIWAGLPLYPEELGPLPTHGTVSEKLRGVRIFPKSHGYPLADWMVGSLCEWLVKHRLPLFIWHVELDWSSLRVLARAFPELNIIVESQTQKVLYHSRPLFTLLRDCPNLFVEISNFVGAGFLEHAVRQFGAERLIFGSFLPMNDPLVPMGMILDAEISDAEKAMIAGGNLRALIAKGRL
jgi:hypothetical protein